jgi:hypothetical protein
MLKRLFVLAALAVLSTPALAQIQDENLLTPMPAGFTVGYQAAEGPQEIHELIPEGESIEAWSAMVTVQIFRGLGGIRSDDFAGNMAGGWQQACPDAVVNKIEDGTTNGYPYALWSFVCPMNPATGQPETMWFKGISGADAFYSVQYAFRAASSPEREQTALGYLGQASACDTRKPGRPCPAGM